jgi:hypothetical protein
MWPVDAPEPVVIGSDTEGLTIRIVSRMHPGADDYWDGNWLVSPVEVRVGGFTGRVAAGLRAEELARLREGLEALYASLEGEARLESLEDWVTLTCRGDGKGHVDVRGTVVDRPGVGNTLEFRLALDQTQLPPIIDQLRAVEHTFPVLGQPGPSSTGRGKTARRWRRGRDT